MTNSILHLQGVITSVVNGCVTYDEFGELAGALEPDTL